MSRGKKQDLTPIAHFFGPMIDLLENVGQSIMFKSLFKSSLAILRDEIKEKFAKFLERHNFVPASDPIFEDLYKGRSALLYRSPKFEIFIARQGDISVFGRPTYADEPWIPIASVLELARGSVTPIDIDTASLVSLMEKNYDYIESFFSRSKESERKLAHQSIFEIRVRPARK